MPEISELYLHPIKSCRGISVRHAKLTQTGFAFDRQFVVVHASSGKFITGRTSPLLALVTPSLPPFLLEPSHADSEGRAEEGTLMTIQAPGMDDLALDISSLVDPSDRRPKSEIQQPPVNLTPVSVWEWKGLGEDQGDEAAAWFTEYLKLPCRLIRYCGAAADKGEGEGSRTELQRFTDPLWHEGSLVAFSDGFPLLLTNLASLEDLSQKSGEDLSMRRFRPNIVVRPSREESIKGASAWNEDEWLLLGVSTRFKKSVELECVKPCTRCKFTTLDPETAVFGEEPLESLGKFRTGKDLGWDQVQKSMKHAVVFGNNVVARPIGEWISVGDQIEVLKKGRPVLKAST